MRSWIAMVVLVAACGSKSPPPAKEPAHEDNALKTAAENTVHCEKKYRDSAEQNGAACFEAAVLGEDMVTACTRELKLMGYENDPLAEQMIGSQTGKTLTCYRRP